LYDRFVAGEIREWLDEAWDRLLDLVFYRPGVAALALLAGVSSRSGAGVSSRSGAGVSSRSGAPHRAASVVGAGWTRSRAGRSRA
jgi:hypothetical protein